MKKAILLLSIGVFVSLNAFSEQDIYQSPNCIRPTGSEALPLDNASIIAILKDSKDFMWFWSDQGLYCYDGTISRPFPAMDFGTEMMQMRETPEGFFLLFGSSGTLGCFDRNKERYIDVVWSDSTLLDKEPAHITYHPKMGLFSTNKQGLLRINYHVDRSQDKPRLVFTPLQLVKFPKPLRQANADKQGRVYAVVDGTHDVVRFDLMANKTEYFKINIPSAESLRHVYKLFVFENEFWYTFHWTGMLYCNTDTRQSVVFDARENDKTKSQVNYLEIQDIAQEKSGRFYMASWSGGMHINFRSNEGQLAKITRAPYFTDIWGQAIEQRALSIYCDQENESLWVGTFGGGVVRYSNDLNYTIPLPKKAIYQVTQDKRGYVWLSTAYSGVLRSNSTKINQKSTFAPWGKGVFSSDRQTIYNDNRRSLWFADNRGTIIQVDQLTEQQQSFYLNTDGKTRIREGISSLCLDATGRLWVATYTDLYYWDTKADKNPIFKRVTPLGLPEGTPLIHIIEDREGIMWLGTQHGLYRLRGSNGVYYAIGGYELLGGATPSMVYALQTNSHGDILAAYSDRLLRINNEKKEKIGIELHAKDGTLPSSHILSIIDDKYGNTWFGTNTAIMVVKSGGNYVSTYSLSNSNRDVCRLEDGRLLWTSAEALTYFHPTEIRDEWTDYKVEFSRLKVNGQDVYAGVPLDGDMILHRSLTQTDTLTLSERHSNFQLYCSDLSFTPFRKRVLYKLESEMTDWQSHLMGEELSLPILSPGVYRLLIKPLYANEAEGLARVLTIIIRPLWYRSTGFVILFLALSIGVLWLLFIWTLKRLRRFRRRHIHRLYDAIQAKNESLSTVPSASTGKILIVGPSREATDRIATVFAEEGFEVFSSHNSADALIDLLYHLPKVVVCSWDMPDVLEFCRKAKENVRSCTVPVVIVDQIETPEHRLEAVEARADDYIALGQDGEGEPLLRQVVENRMSGREAMNMLLSRMIEEQKHSESSDEEHTPSTILIRQIESLVIEHAKDPIFSVKRLSELLNMSQSTLYRKVLKASDGRTVIEVMRDVRLRRAAELLTEENWTISAVAEEVGYQDVATFRKHFSDLFGLNPSNFVKMQEKNPTVE